MIRKEVRIRTSDLQKHGIAYRGVEPAGPRQSPRKNYCIYTLTPFLILTWKVLLLRSPSRCRNHISCVSPLQLPWPLLFPLYFIPADSHPVQDFAQLHFQLITSTSFRNFNFNSYVTSCDHTYITRNSSCPLGD